MYFCINDIQFFFFISSEANCVIAVEVTKALDIACKLFIEETFLESLTFIHSLSSFERSSKILVKNRALIER